jgi:large subunit ribosomal protein L9
MEVILLEKSARLGNLGDIVKVKNGFARNFLIPQKKAIRATKENKDAFESRKIEIQKEMDVKIAQANQQKLLIDGKNLILIRQASDEGRLYGSVNSTVIANAISEEFQVKLSKASIILDEQIKYIGSYPIKAYIYADVIALIKVIVARSAEEAEVILAGKAPKIEVKKDLVELIEEETAIQEENSDSTSSIADSEEE